MPKIMPLKCFPFEIFETTPLKIQKPLKHPRGYQITPSVFSPGNHGSILRAINRKRGNGCDKFLRIWRVLSTKNARY